MAALVPRIGRLAVDLLAAIALCWFLVGLIPHLVQPWLSETTIIRRVVAPHGPAAAEVTVTTMGATVRTTRVILVSDEQSWTVYEAGDSGFAPPLRWADEETLIVGLPCSAFRHLANPLEGSGDHALKVRFAYPERCPPDGS